MSDSEIAKLPDYERTSSPPELLQISVFNAGPAPAIINCIKMQVGDSKIKDPVFLDNPDANNYDPMQDLTEFFALGSENFQAFPVGLGYGDSTSWHILSGEDEYPDRWIDSLVEEKKFVESFVQTEREAETFKFILYTSQGQKDVTPGKEILKRIVDAYTRSKNATPDQS